MSVNIHLYLDILNLASAEEADAVAVSVEEVLKDHGIESWMQVGVYHQPPKVLASSEHGPIIISGFGKWSERFEADATEAIRATAPDARIELEWGYPDES
ncbi:MULTISPECIES: hypothetical protein [unclassified Streptomyces]|uniref:hypothetical protein n=1 Tax=unclassified Streptomyces TaxID=2593676 RepID=UPI0036E50BBC